MDKTTTVSNAIKIIKNGDVILVGGFLQAGSPETLVGALLTMSNARGLTIISNDTGNRETKMIQIIKQGRVDKVIASYIGANPETGRMYLEQPGSVELVPQGTLAERIRAGGAGIPGFYTPVGAGTVVADGKEQREIQGKTCLLEMGITGNVAFIKATIADRSGNLYMRGSTKNFNAIMACAADYVIAEASEIVAVGELDPEMVTVPAIFVDALVPAEV